MCPPLTDEDLKRWRRKSTLKKTTLWNGSAQTTIWIKIRIMIDMLR